MSNSARAKAAKEAGNEAYKKRDFATAHKHYDEAITLDPTDIVYRNNKAAVYFEEAAYDACLETCAEAVNVGRENQADFKHIAKAFARAANAYERKGELKNAYDFLQKSLSEHRDPNIVKKAAEIDKQFKEQERLAYINPEIAEEEKTKGNAAFAKGDYPTAIKHYTESLRRNPDNCKVYSNRAASYHKLMEFHKAIKDSEECIRMDPLFVKGYLRKAAAYLGLKDTSKARDAYQKALELDPGCQEAKDGVFSCRSSPFLGAAGGGQSEADLTKRAEAAMKNPEIQEIMADPGMRMILKQMQENPNAAAEHLKNDAVKEKILKLVDSGILQMR